MKTSDAADFDARSGHLASLWLRAKEFGEGGGGIGREHQAGADEEGVETRGAQFCQFGGGADAGFADGDAVVGYLVDQFERGFDADIERFQIAVVDADDFCAGGDGAREFFAGVNFDHRLHAEFPAESDQFDELLLAQRRDDQQKTVGVIGARFPDLPRIEDKILAKNGS